MPLNRFIANLLTSHLDPDCLGISTKTETGKLQLAEFMRGLQIQSWELFVVTEFDMRSEKQQNTLVYDDFVSFLVLKSGLSNEMCSHQDLMNPEKHPGDAYRLLHLDYSTVKFDICRPDADVPFLRQVSHIPFFDKFAPFDSRAFEVSNYNKSKLLSCQSANVFI